MSAAFACTFAPLEGGRTELANSQQGIAIRDWASAFSIMKTAGRIQDVGARRALP